MVKDSKFGANTIFRDQKTKRQDVREAIEEDPDASNVAIAEQTGVSDPTVGSVRKEMESEPSPEPTETHEEPSESDPEPRPEVPRSQDLIRTLREDAGR